MSRYNGIEWVNQRFGFLTVIGSVPVRFENGKRQWYWKVRCTCGKEKVMKPYEVINGHSVSCGCHRKNRSPSNKSHNESHTRLHSIWCDMTRRCRSNPHYFGRGISVCKEWESFERFRDWAVEKGYTDELTIERKDVNGNYSPENCEWIPLAVQARNRTTTKWVNYNGERMSLAQAVEIAGLPYKQVHWRIQHGWSIEDALSKPIRRCISC